MKPRTAHHALSQRVRAWWAVSAVLVAIGITALVLAIPSSDPASLVLAGASPRAGVSPTRAVRPTAAPSLASSKPVWLRVPSIGINLAVGRLGLDPNGQVMVPATPYTVGWYVHGPTPDQLGSAVILGHVDSYLGPGVFFRLRDLVAGSRIDVTLMNGAVASFRVTRVMQFAKTAFPDRLVYGSHGTRSLQLVTCGGTFDHATGSYESNIVVFSTLASVTKPL